MFEHKKFIDIPAFQTKYADAFKVGQEIYIEEKVDGSNAFLSYNEEKDCIVAGSRKHILREDLTLDGFYEYAKTLDKDSFKKYNGYILYGEWNLKHLIKYPPEKVKKFWAYDAYDIKNKKWMPQEFAIKMAKDCGMSYVPIFYKGPFISWEHIEQFIGRSDMGADQGEGIVIKNQDNLNNPSSREPFVVKLVCSQYKERMNKPPKEPLSVEELEKKEYNQKLVASVVTPVRVEKCLYKMIMEDELIPKDWDSSHMKTIAQNLPRIVYHDCEKEAPEIVAEAENFGKICGSLVMNIVRELLTKQ